MKPLRIGALAPAKRLPAASLFIAFILLCIGMQIMWMGIHDLIVSLPPRG